VTLYFQGDVCIERVEDAPVQGNPIPPASDGAVVLAHGELTGHRHAFYGGGVTLFKDDALAQDMPPELYIGHLKVEAEAADLMHEEHDTIRLGKGTWRIRLQREYREKADESSDPRGLHYRVVED
jgi:hypothetical protein